jgi:hypothetical protein
VRLTVSWDERLTPGVHREGGDLVHEHLGIRLPDADDAHDLAADLGLVSTCLSVGGTRWRMRIPPWLHPLARPLPAGALAATTASIAHNAAGMSLFLVVAAGALTAGWASGSIALTGLATATVVVLISVLVHEAGHVIAYRLLMPRDAPGILVVRGLSCHLVRAAGGHGRDAGIVLAGAIGPVVAAAALVPLYSVASFVVAFAILVAVAHVALLAIPIGDGAALRDLRRARA